MKRYNEVPGAVKPAEPPVQKKRPRQARSKFTLDVILEAAEQLLLQQGSLDAVTTRQVALRAGVGVGTLYDYFPNRDAILVQLLNRRMRKECEAAVPRFRGESQDGLPELFGDSVAQAVEMDRKLMRYGGEFHARYARHFFFGTYYPELNSPARTRVLETIEEQALRLLENNGATVREEDKDLAAYMLTRALRGMVSTLIEDRPELLDAPALVQMLQRTMLAIVDYHDGDEGKAAGDSERAPDL